MIKMAQLEIIRKMYFMEGLSIREISRRTGIHRDTISKYLSLEEIKPPKYKQIRERKHPVLGPYISMIKQIMEDDKTRHRKQRHTGTKIFEILKAEGFPGGYNTISDYLRKEYRKQREAFLPLEFDLGAYAEVDWTEAYFYLNGKETKAHIFVMKLRGSGGFYVRAYPFEKQEAFFDGHIKCFEFMNGVPYKIAYDNLKTAVKKVLQGSNREEQEQFIALRTHYLYESTFCRPAKGNEKGGVENAGKEAVRKFFVPYPEVDSFEELNQYLHNECIKLLEKNQKWEAEKAALRPLPTVRFDGARYKEVKVNRYSMIQFETNRYSVPKAYVGESVTVKATAEKVDIMVKNSVIAEHPRLYGRNKDNIVLDHYLELLLQKSRALGNTKVYKPQKLPAVYEQYRRCILSRNPRGNREFVKILMLHREHSTEIVAEAIEIAMAYNVYGYDGVLNILGQMIVSSHNAVPLSKDRLQSIPEVRVKPPELNKFSALMTGGIN
ncbi:MAG: IS21 family transposase [Clostridia bacterium]|nr:IS21 family transposase [Clostridia bacterium]